MTESKRFYNPYLLRWERRSEAPELVHHGLAGMKREPIPETPTAHAASVTLERVWNPFYQAPILRPVKNVFEDEIPILRERISRAIAERQALLRRDMPLEVLQPSDWEEQFDEEVNAPEEIERRLLRSASVSERNVEERG